jgi:hypothetical protein
MDHQVSAALQLHAVRAADVFYEKMSIHAMKYA